MRSNKPLQTDERRAAVVAEQQWALAPLAAERQAVMPPKGASQDGGEVKKIAYAFPISILLSMFVLSCSTARCPRTMKIRVNSLNC